jgi:HAD superfamily hydrolase (TIGR01509 family)
MEIRNQGFLELFINYPEHIQEIDRVLRSHQGVNRVITLREVFRSILGQEPDEKKIAELSARYSNEVVDKVINESQLISGVLEFLEQTEKPKFVATSAPQADATRLLSSFGLRDRFEGVYAYPVPKKDAIISVYTSHKLAPSGVLFFGDAPADAKAAAEAGTPFIAITRETSLFPPGTPSIRDFRALLH